MTNPHQVIEAWTNLKQKLLTTITELKTNHKDNWALVKAKSVPPRVIVARDESSEELKARLARISKLVAQQDYPKLQRLYEQGEI